MTPDYATIGLVLAALFFLLQVASLIITIWQRLRRSPPIDQTLKEYVLKTEFAAHCEQNDRSLKELYDLQRDQTKLIGTEIKDLSNNLARWQQGIAQQIGRLEGQVATICHAPKKDHHE